MNTSSPRQLVINWHLTEACNYRCQYCYAAWQDSACKSELVKDTGRTIALLRELYRFFRPENHAGQLAEWLDEPVRLNLAGGEPLLHAARLAIVVDEARRLGFEVSMITNGSRLNHETLEQLAPNLTWLGISIDSADPVTNHAIGRVDRSGKLINLDHLACSLRWVRQRHPQMCLKINTVVNALNWPDNLGGLISRFAPDKWKLLRMLPVVNHTLAITDQQFTAFVKRHEELKEILCVEDNQDMRESYLMVDPHGRFFQNSLVMSGQGYVYSDPILKVGAEAAFKQMSFDLAKFRSRYIPITEVA